MDEKFYSIIGRVSKYMPADFIKQVVSYCNANDFDGYIHVGCPLGANADDEKLFTADALLITKQCGVIIFVFPQDAADKQKILTEQDMVYAQTENYFRNYRKTLMKGRSLIFDFEVVSIVPNDFEAISDGYNVCSSYEMSYIFSAYNHPLDEDTYQKIRSALQKVAGLRSAVENDSISEDDIVSLGGKMANIGRAIKTMDEQQHRAANEFTKSALRIRGIAGSGKTIVLAGRAAYLHSQYPGWNIAITFYSRALKQQLKNLITTFYRTYNPYREPNWEKIHILHSWGEFSGQEGLYSRAAKSLKAPFRNFKEAKRMAGGDDAEAFSVACEELLSEKFICKCKPEYDAVLIDEAQDMPASFFKLVYNFTEINDEGKKCIIWAYDELQSLQNITMPTESELFGKDENGRPLISLVNEEDKPKEQISLFKCYRNPPWILVVAHALGFGIYRRPEKEELTGLIQMFDDLNAWENVGYECVEGNLDFEQKVVLCRMASATPDYFGKLLTSEESIQCKKFDTIEEQYEWVAGEIERNINEDKLKPEEILVVFLRQKGAWNYSAKLGKILNEKDIDSGYIGKLGEISSDEFRVSGKVTMTQIYRAKGNEAPMVYVLDADYCALGTVERRNMLFTAITRSKAWVRITGVGKGMDVITDEINACKENDYKLAFTIPSKAELENIKRINQEAQADIEQKLNELIVKAMKLFNNVPEEQKENLIALIDSGNIEEIKAFMRKYSSSGKRKRRS